MVRVRPVDAAFEGFRIVRDRPQLIVAWTGFYLVSLLVMILLLLVPNFGTLGAAVRTGGDRTLEELSTRFGWPLLVVLVMALLMITVLTGAIYRSVLRPDESRFAYLKFGMDEVRLLGLYLGLVTVCSLISAVYGIAVVLVLPFAGGLQWLVAAPLALGGLLLVGGLLVRLALAGPAIVADHRLGVIKAWLATRGQFWPLVGSALLSLVFYFGVFLVAAIVSAIGAALFGGFSLLGELKQTDLGTITPVEAWTAIGLLLLQQVIWTLLIVIWFVMFCAAPSRALLQLRAAS